MFEPPISPSDIAKHINAIRANPRILVPKLEKQLPNFKGKSLTFTPGFSLATVEGAPLWKETIEFLRKQKPMPPLTLHKGLCKSAQEHVVDLAKHNMIGHTGSNGSTMGERIRRYNEYLEGLIGENVAEQLSFKGRDHAFQTLVTLILDDGVPNRGHRLSLFSNELRYFGSASCKGSSGILTVITMSSEDMKPIEGQQPPENRSQYSDIEDTAMPGEKGTPIATIAHKEESELLYDVNQVPITKYPYHTPENAKLPIIPQDIQKHLNQIRRDPKSLIPQIEKSLALFDETGMILHLPNTNYKTYEGRKAWIEAIEFLSKQQQLHPMTIHSGLCKCAQLHAVDLSRNNMTGNGLAHLGHTGSNGKNMTHRITKFNKWETYDGGPGGAIGENGANTLIDMGEDLALQTLVTMVIDDGIATRSHRMAIFSPQYRYFGSASCRCNKQTVKTVINFSEHDLLPIPGVQPPENLGEYTGKEGNPPATQKVAAKPGLTKPGLVKPSQPTLKTLPTAASVATIKPLPPKTLTTNASTTKIEIKPKPILQKPPAVSKIVDTKPTAIKPAVTKPVATKPTVAKPVVVAKPTVNKSTISTTASQAKLSTIPKK